MPPLTDRHPLPVLAEPGPRDGARAEPAPHWRTLAELRGEPPEPGEFALGADTPPEEGPSRRDFLRAVTASLAAAGLTGCFRQPEEQILPYARNAPEALTPGLPLHFATGLELDGVTTGLVVESHEGRPTKVEGNPAHPWSLGAAGAFEQAALLQLYDAGRGRTPRHRGTATDTRALLAALGARARRDDAGAGLRLLVEPTTSPFLLDVYARIAARYPRARIVPFSPVGAGYAAREGARRVYGRPLEAVPDFRAPRVVLALDEDFLSTLPGNLRPARDFVEGRLPQDLSRLWVAESHFSLTGMYADERLRVRPSQVRPLALAVAARVGTAMARPGLAGLAAPGGVLSEAQQRWAEKVAEDLVASRGRALVVAGDGQPPEVHALALLLNEALGSPPRLLEPVVGPEGGPEALGQLIGEMRAGAVDTLLITAWNPVYAAPVDAGFAEALGRVAFSAYHGLREDETAARVGWYIPATHPFESWRDGRAPDGTASILQPLIAPLFAGAVDAVDVLGPFFGGEGQTAHAHLKRFWRERVGAPGDFQRVWEGWLAEGVIPGTAAEPVRAEPREAEALAALRPLAPGAVGLELRLVPDLKVYDGRFAHNAWLQELPDPVTQLTWDNAALLSPATAAELGVEDGRRVRLDYRGQVVEVPALVLPGHADGVVTLALGYGREAGDGVGAGVGVSAYRLRHLDAPWGGPGLAVTLAEGHEPLALAQLHGRMDGRELALQFDARGFDARVLQPLQEEPPHLYPPVLRMEEARHRWGMAIDLHRCTGCSACVVACQAENNIPTVGREQVRRGREMHWLRLDRYFIGGEEDPQAIHQPVMCVHCEYAPCEYVCPVNATVHTDEGLNAMVYNRCIGTRYCSNNCPYKVRRFNYLNYTYGRHDTPLGRMFKNPEVTVRSRGVMEKCTYCVQRIQAARIHAGVEHRPLRGGEVRTACQQTCPTGAIVFGDLDEEGSEVRRLHADPRHYALLNGLGTRPRTAHLARLKNPAPEVGG
ncbi:Fe-S-cluster-containing hydrogenase [Myxococcaceae bacterium GXIMD 01537]